MTGPTPEHVADDPYQNDPRIVTAFNSSSPSGDLTAEVVYANYGTPEDFKKLADLHVSIKGKIVLVRYGHNFRGVKVYLAQLGGAAGVIIYSDPSDDGFSKGKVYPDGPYRPATGVQRGSVQYIFKYPGDATTPGFASDPDLPADKRIPPEQAASQPTIPATPISWQDAEPILKALTGPAVPKDWQGGLPFEYHTGPGGVSVHLVLKQDYAYRTIWDVIGTIDGSTYPDEWVVAGNHRDAWVFGAVDPSSGTAACSRPSTASANSSKPVGSRSAPRLRQLGREEEGLIGSTEWAEGHARHLEHTVAYFNTDVSVSGPDFSASAVPTLKQFVRDVAKEVPSAKGATVYDQWKSARHWNPKERQQWLQREAHQRARHRRCRRRRPRQRLRLHPVLPAFRRALDRHRLRAARTASIIPPSTTTPGIVKNADPDFTLLQQQARVFGLEVIKMADAGVCPTTTRPMPARSPSICRPRRRRLPRPD
jgi:N-acetylated-alpha-linked acidic dipeptidase